MLVCLIVLLIACFMLVFMLVGVGILVEEPVQSEGLWPYIYSASPFLAQASTAVESQDRSMSALKQRSRKLKRH